MRDTQLFLSLEHLEDFVGLLISLISVLLNLRKKEGTRRGGEMGEWMVGGTNRPHTYIYLSLPSYICVAHVAPKQL